MSLKHFWYTLLDSEGEEVSSANVYVYEAGTTTELTIYDYQGQLITQPIVTGSDGIVEFSVKDQFESSNNYGPDQRMKILWSASASSVTGEIDNAEIFDKVYKFEDFNEGDYQPTDYTYKNKLVSNQTAYNWNTHIDLPASTLNLHNILPVDVNDSSDNTYNKSVSNDLFNSLWSLLASAQSPTITASGAVVRLYDMNPTSGGSPTWSASGDLYYGDFNHGLQELYPLVQIYDDTNKEVFKPYTVLPIDDENIRLFILEDIVAHVTVVG